MTVVTSRYHAFRTNYIFERCLAEGTDVEVIATPTDLPWHWWLYRLTYENAAFVKAVLETEVKC